MLRTLHLEFKQANWWQQLTANYATAVDIPASLTLDGVTYDSVEVRFKGVTSYSMTGNSQKKPFNISMDYKNPDQRLMGYRTLNLNNAHLDPSFMREALYFDVLRRYTPGPKACFVKLTINGENWGVYAHAQQLNADMVKEWFLNNNGNRWKAGIGTGAPGGAQPGGQLPGGQLPGGRQPGGQLPGGQPGGGGFASGDRALLWLGSDSTRYKSLYELKSANTPDPWGLLMTACNVLNNTPLAQLADSVETVLAVDRWLWFLAVENVFTDEDSYLSKGWDYQFYYDVETGQIHPLEHDGNESFDTRAVQQSPVAGEGNANRPVISKLLSVPTLRQRYLAHMRTILNESFDFRVLAPKMEQYRALIEKEVRADTKKLYSNDQFVSRLSEVQGFVTSRRAFLLSHAEINRPAPEIVSVARKATPEGNGSVAAGQPVQVTAQVGEGVGVGEMILYYADGVMGRFKRTSMFDDGAHGDDKPGDGVYGAEIPPYRAGSLVRYYVEARADDGVGTAAFAPAGAEHDVFVYRVSTLAVNPVKASSTPVVINELMASNTATAQDPQGEYDDWIELLNVSDQEVDLSGMYLTDREDNLKKWAFPDSTRLAPGAYLIVWADENGSDKPGFHASFKLSASGESILLVDKDARGNLLLDVVRFGEQKPDISSGRSPNGTGAFQALSRPTPGAKNGDEQGSSDFNGDGKVDFSDFFLFAESFGKKQTSPGYESRFDLDGDGEIGFSDFFIFASAFGRT